VKDKIRIAFQDVRCGYSADRVVADPSLNLAYVDRCTALGISASVVEVNLQLLNFRKAGLFKGLPRSRRTSFSDEDSYRFASEIAARYIEKRDSVALDRIICDPILAAQFDEVAADIAAGFLPLQYRWAALNLRKARSLRPELLSHVVKPVDVSFAAIEAIDERDLPTQQGIYIFYSSTDTLYVGEGGNLRRRVAKHLDHSDNKNLARWLWSNGYKSVRLELQVFPDGTSTRVRRALESELISSRRPLFNVQRLLQRR
jgi:hypothetical protein